MAADDEEVWVAIGMDLQERADSRAILIVDLEAVLPANLVIDAGLLNLEAGRVNEHVEFVLIALEHRPLLVDFGDALAVRIDEMDVRPIIGWQIRVIETRALAHEHLPRLERLGGRLILDD